MKQSLSIDDYYNILLLNVLMGVASINMLYYDYNDFLAIIEKSLSLVDRIQQPTYKPGIIGMKAKYYLNHEKDTLKATAYYDEAISFASILGDEVLVTALLDEKKSDNL